jgi:predicted RNA binding protein YcfA (HicA-like mRNA interferase family)/predicted RNase H-like HicB family nuclease
MHRTRVYEGTRSSKMLDQDGWYLDRTRGSHQQFKHPVKRGLVTVAGKPNDGLGPGTFNSILKTGGLKEMKKYLIVIEETRTGYSAYSPDLDGCAATGATREEVERQMREAIAFHLEGMARSDQPVPEPHTYSAYVEVPA